MFLVVGGVSGSSLWCSGDRDVLLARDGRVQVFATRAGLLAGVIEPGAGLTPPAVTLLDRETLRRVVEAPAATFDLDAAAAWYSNPGRPATIEDCDSALDALNMATDIAATAGDEGLAGLMASDALRAAHDALTFGLTLLGDGGPFRNDPVAMTAAITADAAAARVLALAASHVEAR